MSYFSRLSSGGGSVDVEVSEPRSTCHHNRECPTSVGYQVKAARYVVEVGEPSSACHHNRECLTSVGYQVGAARLTSRLASLAQHVITTVSVLLPWANK